MATTRQRKAARKNIRKATAARRSRAGKARGKSTRKKSTTASRSKRGIRKR